MGRYSIKDLEKLSGIKAHTLRIWEKRYRLLEPQRTTTNIRYYTDNDLKKILNVSLLNNSGTKISKIVAMHEEEIKEAIDTIEDDALIYQKRIDELIFPVLEYDEKKFCQLFNQSVEELGIESTFTSIIYPFLEKVGILWLQNEVLPSQEHFITNIIRQKICQATDSLPSPKDKGKKVILFLPEGEYHELGLLFFSFLYKKAGVRTFYFGQSVPLDQVKKAAEMIRPDWILTYSIIKPKQEIQALIDSMNTFRAEELFFLENRHQDNYNLNYPKKVSRLTHYQDDGDARDLSSPFRDSKTPDKMTGSMTQSNFDR